jgi:hypothetical protein
MKRLTIGLTVLSLACLLLTVCSKNKEVILKPRLHITLKNDSAKSVAGATVRLYKNAQDSVAMLISDTRGVVFFENLEPVIYYWIAEKGCSTNRMSQVSLNRPLVTDAVLYGNSVVSGTGVLKITNISGEPYKLSDSLFSIVLNDTPYIAYRRVGSYNIHSEKLSTPGVGKDTLIEIRCGDTTRIILPY